MTYREIAELIPPSYRKEIIDTEVINTAAATTTDQGMNYLAVIWRSYIDPNLNTGCNVCMQQLLTNWRNLQPTLVEMQKESNLLSAL